MTDRFFRALCAAPKIGGIAAFTQDFDVTLTAESTDGKCPLVTSLAMYEGEKPPKLQYFLLAADGTEIYRSYTYTLGEKGQYSRKAHRFPPLFSYDVRAVFRVSVPNGTTLYVRDMHLASDTPRCEWHGGLRHDAHLGFLGLAPHNTMPAFELAAACGFPSCIVVPKVTKDGVFVCIHDDTINRTARDRNGDPPKEEMAVADMTYRELLEWDFGMWHHPIYRGTRIPRLEEFFDLCAKTGMRPFFSEHPALTNDQWLAVKDMLKRRDLLHLFSVKSDELPMLEDAYAVLGDEIEGYTWYTFADRRVSELQATRIASAKCRVVVERRFGDYTPELAKETLDAGYTASAWWVDPRDADDVKRVIAYGVTEFTEDRHCSMGLDW